MHKIAYQTKQSLDKKKKKLTDFQKKVFFETVYTRGLENYCKSMARLCHALSAHKVIKGEINDQALAARYAQRYKVFENVFFIRRVEFDEYKKAREEIAKMDV